MKLRNSRGVAMTVAIMMIICSSILAGYALQAGWNQRRLTVGAGSKRDQIYWAARAGVVNARWRIREGMRNNNSTGCVPAGDFNNAAYDPNTYNLDINGNGVNDVTVDIGPVQNGMRGITSTGLDV